MITSCGATLPPICRANQVRSGSSPSTDMRPHTPGRRVARAIAIATRGSACSSVGG
jgi:hypothetical protein